MKVPSAPRQSVAQKNSIPVIVLLVSLWLAPTARAQFTLDFVYDSGTDTTTAIYSGSWASMPGKSNVASGGFLSFSTDAILALNASYSVQTDTTFAGSMPWVTATISSHSGDSWGFNTNSIFASYGYTAGNQLSGTLSFVGSDLTDLGFDVTEIATGGVLGSGSNTVTWTASVAAVPEPATYALLWGIVALGCAVYRNRRR